MLHICMKRGIKWHMGPREVWDQQLCASPQASIPSVPTWEASSPLFLCSVLMWCGSCDANKKWRFVCFIYLFIFSSVSDRVNASETSVHHWRYTLSCIWYWNTAFGILSIWSMISKVRHAPVATHLTVKVLKTRRLCHVCHDIVSSWYCIKFITCKDAFYLLTYFIGKNKKYIF